MLIIEYAPEQDTVLVSDSKIESFLFEQLDKGPIEVTISQISIIYVLRKLIAEKKINSNDIRIVVDGNIHSINPTGRFVIGGPHGDAGLTGRKIIVDTYGGMGRHGGGAFSGKDPTKVDRSACYAARWVAKNIVASGVADMCELQVSYAIGVAHPTSIAVNTFGTGKVSDDRIVEIVKTVFDLRPGAIIRDLDLRRPLYKQTAAYGHFGRTDIDVPWEKTNKVEEIKALLG